MRFKAIIIACALLLTVSGAVALTYLAGPHPGKKQTPEEVTTQFLQALAQNDYDALRKLCTDETHAMIDLLQSLGELSSEAPATTTPVEKVTKCEEVKGKDIANCEVCCDAEGNSSNVSLHKVDGNWLVHMEKE